MKTMLLGIGALMGLVISVSHNLIFNLEIPLSICSGLIMLNYLKQLDKLKGGKKYNGII